MQCLSSKILAEIDKGVFTAAGIELLVDQPPEHRWALGKALLAAQAEGRSIRSVERSLKKRARVRTKKEILSAITALTDFGRLPSWFDAMCWCAGMRTSQEFFDVPLDKLREYDIIE